MVDAGPELTNKETMRVLPPPPWGFRYIEKFSIELHIFDYIQLNTGVKEIQ